MVNYLSKFSRRLADIAAPINAVTGHRAEWCWEDAQKTAFEEIRKEISCLPTLCNFDLNRKHRVSADSSCRAVGAVLLQLNDNSEWQPVEYASRKLTEAEQRYAMIEKEALAVTWACEKFDYYLVGREFEVETDHKPLVAILGEKDLSKLPLRVQRFKLRMMRYGYTVFHTPGTEMHMADLLSRPVNAVYSDENLIDSGLVEQYVCDFVRGNLLDEVREAELINALHKDSVSRECLSQMQKDWCDFRQRDAPEELRKLYSSRYKLTTYGGIILFDSRLYIPEGLRDKYLHRCHEAHQGIEKCRRRARQLFWWPSVSSDIETYISTCETCIKRGQVKHQPVEEQPLPAGPWQEIATDLFVFDNDNYLVVIDYYSKWIEAVPLLNQTSTSVIRELKLVFSRYGIPSRVRSDNGPCFDSGAMRDFATEWGFSLDTSSPRYPQSNGLAERAVGIVKRLWAGGGDKTSALLAYRTTPLRSGYSPSQLLYARPIRSQLGYPEHEKVDYDRFESLEEENKVNSAEKWGLKHRVKRLPELHIGEKVWVKAPTDTGKEGVVVRKDTHPESYWVKVGESEIRRNRKHLFSLEDSHNMASDTVPPTPTDRGDIRLPSISQESPVGERPEYEYQGEDRAMLFPGLTEATCNEPSEPGEMREGEPEGRTSDPDTLEEIEGVVSPGRPTPAPDPPPVGEDGGAGRLGGLRSRYGRQYKPVKRDEYQYY